MGKSSLKVSTGVMSTGTGAIVTDSGAMFTVRTVMPYIRGTMTAGRGLLWLKTGGEGSSWVCLVGGTGAIVLTCNAPLPAAIITLLSGIAPKQSA